VAAAVSATVRRMRRAWVALLLLAACYERGGSPARPPADDAGAAPVVAPRASAEPPLAQRDPGAILQIALEAEPATLDPFVAADGATLRLLADVYEGLLCPGDGPSAPPVPCLATAYTVADGGRRWRFTLRDGVRFHDGTPVTAADVVFSVGLLQGPVRSHLAADLDDLVAVRAEAGAVVLRFGRGRADRASAIARIPIVPRRAFAGVDLDRPGGLEAGRLAAAPVGTGPLRVVGWHRGEFIETVRHDGYWGPPALAAGATFRITADRADALRALARGSLDVVYQVPVDQAVRFSDESPGVRPFRYLLPAYLAAVLNTRRPALATARARTALAALLDGPTIRRTILGGAPAPTGPFAPGDAGIDPAVTEIGFDPAAAGAVRGATLTVLVPAGSRAMARIADVWAADARGVATLAVEEVPFAELVARLREGRFDVALTSLTTGPELDLWPRLHSAAPADEAWSGLRDPALDELLDRLRAEPAADARVALRRALHRRLTALVPMIVIAADARMGVAAAGVGGLGDGSGGPPPARRLWRVRR
jgi:peptide/nickel transport system substrate-binding protein